MSLFLHLSDLHLVSPDHDATVGDYKSEIVPQPERQRRQDILKTTLQELSRSLSVQDKHLDAIVVTGDITNYGSQAGFDVLPDVLAMLDDRCPTGRVVVLPGNHDIIRDTETSSEERYRHFSDFLRKHSFTSPALEGLDINAESGELLRPDEAAPRRYLLDKNQKWLMVPINCANYYGSLEPLNGMSHEQWEEATAMPPDGSDTADVRGFREYLMGLRRRDVARVSPAQMDFVRRLILQAEAEIGMDGGDPEEYVYLALFHHHLLPVSNAEEFKSFEALTNLGPFRQFLKANRFKVVLHGHKHVDHVYYDYITDASKGVREEPHRVLVISGATLGNTGYMDQEVLRLIELDTHQFTPELTVWSVPAVHSGHSLSLGDLKSVRVPLYDDRMDNPIAESATRYINARTASEAYARILRGDDSHSQSRPLVCQIIEADSISELADKYPKDPRAVPSNRSAWFQDVTEWWQCPTAELGDIVPFNHGTRIHRYRGDIDQTGRVIEHLQSSAANVPSSRATMILLDHQNDATTERMYPSMCLVQFVLRQTHTGSRLDCIGYFRKQEIEYWWPINVSELTLLQKEVFDGIKHKHNRIVRGTITTVAAIVTRSAGIPRVAIPAIDRVYDLHPEQLWDMVYSIFFPVSASRDTQQELWIQYLDELMPSEERDEDGVPIASAGLEHLLTTTRLFSKQNPAARGGQLVGLLKQLIEINAKFAKATKYGSEAKGTEYRDWRTQVFEIVSEMKQMLVSVFTNA